MSFKEITPAELEKNAFTLIGNDWLLITAAKGDKVNTMTASWGGLGFLWNKNVAYIFIRPQRYTKEFVDSSDTLSLCVLDGSRRDDLNYLGKVSGRDEDKIKKCALTPLFDNQTPYFEESKLVLICKKLFAQELKEDSFIQKDIIERYYPSKDYHTMYVVEIEKILTK
ncbi:MAG: flavin reductase family protein [Ruminococcaceae bacterium]|nr:flavin reductase family protein [Oscillospiraceae bacterium]